MLPASLRSIGLLLALALGGCSSLYYNALEQFGIEKRQILVDRVEDARDAQAEARDQFVTALEEFSALVDFDGGDLEDLYDTLNSEFEQSQTRAQAVSERIDAVEDVSEDLFDEWEDELDLYSSEELRRSSAQTLRDTRERYGELISAMRQAEQRMTPVINSFQDQVLFLRHNLNSQAIASLRDELDAIESEIAVLIEAMESSIAESNRFITQMGLT